MNTPVILVAEDSLTQAELLRHTLAQTDWNVTVTGDGREALAAARRLRPALVISDVVMPYMTGYELCHALKHDATLAAVPVILLTSMNEPDDIIKGLACGADDFMTKPYDPAALLVRVRRMIENPPSRQDQTHEVVLQGTTVNITASRLQIFNLLLATYDDVAQKNKELREANRRLEDAVHTIKTLRGFIPICSYCKKIRNDIGYWQQVEAYVAEHSTASFTHGICPACETKLLAESEP